jgi:hypothetical protein
MGMRKKWLVPWEKTNDRSKLEMLKGLRGLHDQTIRCGVIEILYGQRGETNRFLEDAILMFERKTGYPAVNLPPEVEKGSHFAKLLWQPGANEDGD